MNPKAQASGADEVTLLGEPRMTFRASRKTLFWSYLIALLPAAAGIALLALVVGLLVVSWSGDVLGCLVYFLLGVLLLWGAKVLWGQADRLRRLQVVVHTEGLCYRKDGACLACRWDQIAAVWGGEMTHYEESSLAVGGIVPIPGTTVRTAAHVSHHYTVCRQDGARMILTDEIRNVVQLTRIIEQEVRRRAAPQ
jgi:hypothetical protein